jgi:hypothetical protein
MRLQNKWIYFSLNLLIQLTINHVGKKNIIE